MARFTYTLTGMAPNQVLTVLDTNESPARTVLQTSAQIHSSGTGTPGDLATAELSLIAVEEAIDSSGGTAKEIGFDLVVKLTADGGDKDVGQIVLNGLELGADLQQLDTNLVNVFKNRAAGDFFQNNYPGDMYSPVIVLRNADYNVCVAMCYDAETFNHAFNITTQIQTGGTKPTRVQFRAANGNALDPWFTIPEGETRVYTVRFRISDRTNTPIGPAPDAPTEWLWTLRGYQRYFRDRYGKPNYRRMGGWDGRPIFARYMADGQLQSGTNPRGWKPENDPTVTGGYNRIADRCILPPSSGLSPIQQGFRRVMIWAMSGWPDTSRQPAYAFKIMTGVESLASPAPETLPAMRRVGWAGLRLGYWWGTSNSPPKAVAWNGLPAGVDQMDPSDPALTAKGYAELDAAVASGATMIGLDIFEFNKPGDAIAWGRIMLARAPRLYFVTEQMMPDYLHVLFPTYIIEQTAVGPEPSAAVTRSYHLANYLNPGSEIVMQTKTVAGTTPLEHSQDLCVLGYSPLREYQLGADEALALTTAERWTELGEFAIARYRAPTSGPRTNERCRSWR